jgi:membrane protease YdiL (CAAX protease family)
VDLPGVELPGGPSGFVALQVVQAVLFAPLINSLFAFGEEFGWRGDLLPKLLPLGERRAALAVGVVWGVWHWPIIALGYNYGLEYPAAPIPGLLAMAVATVALGTVFAWVTLRSGSVWPAAIGHGALNAAGSAIFGFVTIDPAGIVGPAPVMVPGMVPWLVVAAALLWAGQWLDVDPETHG